MKKNTLIILSLLFANFIFSQQVKDKSKTTIEEYNYMTKGYKFQISAGLDMKNGYEIEQITAIKKGNYTFNFNALIRNKNRKLAGILIIAHSKISGRTYYLGMPINNNYLSDKFEHDIRQWDESMTTAYAQATSELFSKTINLFWKNYNIKNE